MNVERLSANAKHTDEGKAFGDYLCRYSEQSNSCKIVPVKSPLFDEEVQADAKNFFSELWQSVFDMSYVQRAQNEAARMEVVYNKAMDAFQNSMRIMDIKAKQYRRRVQSVLDAAQKIANVDLPRLTKLGTGTTGGDTTSSDRNLPAGPSAASSLQLADSTGDGLRHADDVDQEDFFYGDSTTRSASTAPRHRGHERLSTRGGVGGPDEMQLRHVVKPSLRRTTKGQNKKKTRNLPDHGDIEGSSFTEVDRSADDGDGPLPDSDGDDDQDTAETDDDRREVLHKLQARKSSSPSLHTGPSHATRTARAKRRKGRTSGPQTRSRSSSNRPSSVLQKGEDGGAAEDEHEHDDGGEDHEWHEGGEDEGEEHEHEHEDHEGWEEDADHDEHGATEDGATSTTSSPAPEKSAPPTDANPSPAPTPTAAGGAGDRGTASSTTFRARKVPSWFQGEQANMEEKDPAITNALENEYPRVQQALKQGSVTGGAGSKDEDIDASDLRIELPSGDLMMTAQKQIDNMVARDYKRQHAREAELEKELQAEKERQKAVKEKLSPVETELELLKKEREEWKQERRELKDDLKDLKKEVKEQKEKAESAVGGGEHEKKGASTPEQDEEEKKPDKSSDKVAEKDKGEDQHHDEEEEHHERDGEADSARSKKDEHPAKTWKPYREKEHNKDADKADTKDDDKDKKIDRVTGEDIAKDEQREQDYESAKDKSEQSEDAAQPEKEVEIDPDAAADAKGKSDLMKIIPEQVVEIADGAGGDHAGVKK
ncbi:unnamed protein product [Amoebophrya sp. A120]|nr:unnamed protein product [Amoebophrya sp. A120]|eukprot:GSA120T00008572001.1